MYIYVCISHTNLLSSGLSQLIVRTTSIPFPALIRVLRLISTLIRHYDSLLSAECEIFLNNIFQFIDSDKHLWQRTAALEVRLRACKRTLSIDWNYSLFCRADFCCTHMLSLSLSRSLSLPYALWIARLSMKYVLIPSYCWRFFSAMIANLEAQKFSTK